MDKPNTADISLYFAAKVIEARFTKDGDPRTIVLQRLYGRAKAGHLPGSYRDSEGHWMIDMKSVRDEYVKIKSNVRRTKDLDVQGLADSL